MNGKKMSVYPYLHSIKGMANNDSDASWNNTIYVAYMYLSVYKQFQFDDYQMIDKFSMIAN